MAGGRCSGPARGLRDGHCTVGQCAACLWFSCVRVRVVFASFCPTLECRPIFFFSLTLGARLVSRAAPAGAPRTACAPLRGAAPATHASATTRGARRLPAAQAYPPPAVANHPPPPPNHVAAQWPAAADRIGRLGGGGG